MNDAHGVPRWPAAWVELIFNALMLGVVLVLRKASASAPGAPASSRQVSGTPSLQRAGWKPALPAFPAMRGQLFHLYLMAYGAFRFAHEFLRDTPQIIGPVSGCQIAALAVAALGLMGFVRRRRIEFASTETVPNA